MFGNFRQDKGWVVRKDGWLGASYFCIFFFFFLPLVLFGGLLEGESYYWTEVTDHTRIWSTSPTFLILTFSISPSHSPFPPPR